MNISLTDEREVVGLVPFGSNLESLNVGRKFKRDVDDGLCTDLRFDDMSVSVKLEDFVGT